MTTRQRIGALAEDLVARHLEAQGFVILQRNLRLGHREIDIVARKEDLCVMCEVRTRGPGAFEGPLASVDAKKRAKLIRAAQRLWRERWANDPTPPRLRFDVVGVRVDATGTHVEHVPGAFTA